MPPLTPAGRVVALLEWGDVAEADAEIAVAGGWHGAVWAGARALMQGCFGACEHQVAEARRVAGNGAADPAGVLAAGVLAASLHREQERRAEAEAGLRSVLDLHPGPPAGARALLALLVAEMGRDSQARRALDGLLPPGTEPLGGGWLAAWCLLGELASAVGAPAPVLEALARRLRPHAVDFAVAEDGAAFYGSVASTLGRLASALGRHDEAAEHLDAAVAAHRRVGAPLLLAHSQFRLSALLRVHGGEGDWDRAVDLLASAAAVYARLGIEGRGEEAREVLARARPAGALAGPVVFRAAGEGWEIGEPEAPVPVRDGPGLHDLARLLAAPLRSLHVTELLAPAPGLDGPTRQDYEARLEELSSERAAAEHDGDGVGAALARAEADALARALSRAPETDPAEWARHVVGTRIRISLGRIEQAAPAVGDHLRGAVRTGTFCRYEPDQPVAWLL